LSKFVRHKRKDDNHDEIKEEFERLGAGVKDVHSLPDFVDIIVTYQDSTVMVEIKDGAKPPSARKVTPGEQKFSDYWISKGGKWACIKSLEEVRELIISMSSGQKVGNT
jgi:hypothetical protein